MVRALRGCSSGGKRTGVSATCRFRWVCRRIGGRGQAARPASCREGLPATRRQIGPEVIRTRGPGYGSSVGLPGMVALRRGGFTECGRPHLVMELTNCRVAHLIAQHVMPIGEVIRTGVLIGRALLAAHSESILHRDVKSERLMRDRFGEHRPDGGRTDE